MSRFKKIALAGFLTIITLALFHKSLVLYSCRFVLSRLDALTVNYEGLQWEEKALVLRGLTINWADQELSVDQIHVEWNFDLRSYCFCPKIRVIHPQLLIRHLSTSSKAPAPLFYHSSWLKPELLISNGVLQFSSSRFYFSLLPTPSGEKLTLSHQPDLSFLPLLTADLSYQSHALRATFELRETDLRRSCSLLSFLLPQWKLYDQSIAGEASLEGEVEFDFTEGVKELSLQGKAHHLVFMQEAGSQLNCGEVDGSLFYIQSETQPLVWGASCSLQGVDLILNSGWSLKDINGALSIKPEEEIDSFLQGKVVYLNQSTPFSLETRALMANGVWQPITSSLDLEGVCLRATQVKSGAEVFLRGDAKRLLSFAFPSTSADLKDPIPLDLKGEFQWEADVLSCAVSGMVVQDPLESSASFLLPAFKRGKWPQVEFNQATIQAPYFNLKQYAPFLKRVFPDFALEGVLECEAVISPHLLLMTMRPQFFSVKHELGTLSLFSQPGQQIQLGYEWKTGRLCLEAPLVEASLQSHQVDLSLDQFTGTLKLTPECLEMAQWKGICSGIILEGDLKGNLQKEEFLSITTSKIAASLSDVQALLTRFPAFAKASLPIKGTFLSGTKGFVCRLPWKKEGSQVEWTLRGSISDLSFPLNEKTHIREGRCEVFFDSKSDQLTLDKAEGKWDLLDGTCLSIQTKRLVADFSKRATIDLSLRVVDGKKEFVGIEGTLSPLPVSGWECVLDPKSTHIAGIALHVYKGVLNQNLELTDWGMKPVIKASELYPLAKFLKNTGFVEIKQDLKALQVLPLQGKFQADCSFDSLSPGFKLLVTSTDVVLQGRSYIPFQLSAKVDQGKWAIERLQAGALSVKGLLKLDSEGFSLSEFEGDWDQLSFKGRGTFKAQTQKLHCTLESIKADLAALFPLKGNLLAGANLAIDFSTLNESFYVSGETNLLADIHSPLPLAITNKKLIRFSYHPQEGLVAEGLDFQVKHRLSGRFFGDLKGSKMLVPKGGYLSLTGLQVALTPDFVAQALAAQLLPNTFNGFEWEGNLSASGDLQIQPSQMAFQGTINPGRYGWNGKQLNFEQIQIAYDKKALHLRAKTHLEKQPLWSSLQLNVDKELYGVLHVLDHPKSEGLKVTFRSQSEGWSIEGVQGSLYGLDCRLKPSLKRKLHGSFLTGAINLDFSRLMLLFPERIQKELQPLKLGLGYEWQGDLIVGSDITKGFALNGLLQGKEFEALGYRFEQLNATLEANPQKVTLSQLKIEEGSSLIAMKKLEFTKSVDKWFLHIPQLQVRRLRPSLMRKIGAQLGEVKPFIIQDFTLAEIQGELGNMASLEGRGYLTFANQFKKETSLLDLPLELIKKIGLDLGLLTPVEGELKIELSGDKFYLLSLDHAYSHAKRSEFYLAPSKTPSYIDFKGGVHIDLKMHQDVMLKMIEPFTLTIRGTLDKPRYGLQF